MMDTISLLVFGAVHKNRKGKITDKEFLSVAFSYHRATPVHPGCMRHDAGSTHSQRFPNRIWRSRSPNLYVGTGCLETDLDAHTSRPF